MYKIKNIECINKIEKELIYAITDANQEDKILRGNNSIFYVNKFDQRWFNIAETHLELGFMALKKAIEVQNEK